MFRPSTRSTIAIINRQTCRWNLPLDPHRLVRYPTLLFSDIDCSLVERYIRSMSAYATKPTTFVDGEPFPRPSHPAPTTALSPPLMKALSPSHLQRPKLRIITDSSQIPPGVRRPVPIRHPALVKTAPLLARPVAETFPSTAKVKAWQAQLREDILDVSLPFTTFSDHIVSPSPPHPPPPAKARPFVPQKKGHTRRLSDKFKNLFSVLHMKKDDRIPIILQNDEPIAPGQLDENNGRRAIPTRPHRSPGTASFLVTRHLAPDPSLPNSAGTSSTAFSIASKPHFAEKTRLYLAPYGMEQSHFSDPTTLESATETSGRSISSGVVLEKSPGALYDRMGLDEGVRIGAKLKRVNSMPDARVLRLWQ